MQNLKWQLQQYIEYHGDNLEQIVFKQKHISTGSVSIKLVTPENVSLHLLSCPL
jgi:hypothetical protein